ncbi:hypothetical protein AV274_0218, partial [Blastocystis sp. ATCC 50177/Nand II]
MSSVQSDIPNGNASFYVPPDLVKELTAFYQKVNPSKVDTVPSVVEKYKNKEEELFYKLKKKYNQDPWMIPASYTPRTSSILQTPSVTSSLLGSPTVMQSISSLSGMLPLGSSNHHSGMSHPQEGSNRGLIISELEKEMEVMKTRVNDTQKENDSLKKEIEEKDKEI